MGLGGKAYPAAQGGDSTPVLTDARARFVRTSPVNTRYDEAKSRLEKCDSITVNSPRRRAVRFWASLCARREPR